MRDPERIDRILWKIHDLWHKHPDARLNQLLINHGVIPDGMNFYWEDDQVEEALEKAPRRVYLHWKPKGQ